MSHWFLVLRDLFWFCLFLTPIFLTKAAVEDYALNEDSLPSATKFFSAVVLQLILAYLLWKGIIE